MFALLKRIISLSLPQDIAFKLVETMLKPAEVWGYQKIYCDIVNNLKLRFSTCS